MPTASTERLTSYFIYIVVVILRASTSIAMSIFCVASFVEPFRQYSQFPVLSRHDRVVLVLHAADCMIRPA